MIVRMTTIYCPKRSAIPTVFPTAITTMTSWVISAAPGDVEVYWLLRMKRPIRVKAEQRFLAVRRIRARTSVKFVGTKPKSALAFHGR